MAKAGADTEHSGSNGAGTPARLRALLDFHEEAAAALRITIGLLNGQKVQSAKARADTTLDHALALDAARTSTRIGRPPGTKNKLQPKTPHPPGDKESVRERRLRSSKFLAKFDTETPRSFAGNLMMRRGVGTLVRRGYLLAKGEGYVRTNKPYFVAGPLKPREKTDR